MNKLTFRFIICILILSTFRLNGQNSYLDKTVNLPTGQVTLKTVLNSLSKQSGCVFSYDPTKIIDKETVTCTSKETISLRSALTQILPKDVQYKLNGKYIVLQKTSTKIVPKKQPSSAIKTLNSTGKTAGKIDENPNHERLVLPPIINDVNSTLPVTAKEEPIQKQVVDSSILVQKTNTVQPMNSAPIISTESTSNSSKLIPVKEVKNTELKPDLNKADTVKKLNSSFRNFIIKNGFLEVGLSLNKKLGAISINAGLSNIYSIFSMGSDYNKSYLFGIGIGVNAKINNNLGLNFDILRNSLVAGKSYLLQVRASNLQLSPILYYTIGSNFKIFGGATLNLIKSSYVSSTSTTNLGKLASVGLSIGVKIDLKDLMTRKI